jgi:hypothetical protein
VRHAAGPSVIITSSFIGTRSRRAVTSRRSNSRNSSLLRSARRSDHCAKGKDTSNQPGARALICRCSHACRREQFRSDLQRRGGSRERRAGAGRALASQPAPHLLVDAPLAEQLARGLVVIRYRTENLRIVPVFGPAALDVSLRIGHVHVTIDDAPWTTPGRNGRFSCSRHSGSWWKGTIAAPHGRPDRQVRGRPSSPCTGPSFWPVAAIPMPGCCSSPCPTR